MRAAAGHIRSECLTVPALLPRVCPCAQPQIVVLGSCQRYSTRRCASCTTPSMFDGEGVVCRTVPNKVSLIAAKACLLSIRRMVTENHAVVGALACRAYAVPPELLELLSCHPDNITTLLRNLKGAPDPEVAAWVQVCKATPCFLIASALCLRVCKSCDVCRWVKLCHAANMLLVLAYMVTMLTFMPCKTVLHVALGACAGVPRGPPSILLCAVS